MTSAAWGLSLTTYERPDTDVSLYKDVIVSLNGLLAFTGHIFGIERSFSANDHSLSITARSTSASIVDCSAPAKTYRNKTLQRIAEEVLEPFDLVLFVNPSAASEAREKFAKIAFEDGETIFAFLTRLARYRGVLITTDEAGGVFITKTESNPTHGAGLEGRVLRTTLTRDGSERFSEYTGKCQIPGNGLLSVDPTSISATVKDSGVSLYRPITIMPDGHEVRSALKRRMEWERNVRVGRSAHLSYQVTGWEAVPGRLWTPNDLISVDDKTLGIKKNLLIQDVTLTLDEQGETADLLLVHPSAFIAEETPIPVDEKD
jgi:prophage tail gpP-like protein